MGAAGDDDDLEDGRDQTEKDFLRIEHESEILIPAVLDMNSPDIIMNLNSINDRRRPIHQAPMLLIGYNSLGNCLLPPNQS